MSTSPVRQVNARPHETSENECLAAVRRFCRKDPSILEGLLNTVTKEVQQGGWRDLSSNRQVVLLALCTARHPPAAPAVQQGEVDKSKPHFSSQEGILALAEGLFSRGTAFGEEEAVILLLQLIQWKTPYSPKLVGAVEKYVTERLTRPLDSSALLSCTVLTTALPELHQSPTMEKVLNVVADKAASLEAGTVGMICYRLARIGTPQHDRLAKSFGAVSARVGAEGDVFNCLQLFFFLCHQPAADPQTLPILCETIVAATLDKDSIVHLSRAIVHVKETQWRLIQSDWEDLVSSVYVQAGDIVELPVADGGLAGEKNTKEIHRFFLAFLRLQCHFTSLQISSTLLEKTSSAVSNFLSSRKEELISAADPPYPLVQLLLSAGNAHYTKCGLDWMGEMLLQQHNLTAIQAFRFLVLLGDLEVTQPVEVVDYVMDQFLKTASDIPPVQFCAALRSVRRLTDHALTDYHWGPILLTFSQDVLRSWFLHRTPTECVVEAVVDLHALGLREESLYAEALSYLSKKVGVSDETSCCSRKAAEMAKLFSGQLTPYPAVTEFLQIASEKGTDNASVLPSVWAAERDPGSKVIQRTPEEQHCLSLVKAMLDTPSHEREKLLTLATDYTNRVGKRGQTITSILRGLPGEGV
ncbi:hypothetical protein AGDE_07709 [Angomonas deanei]|uniref:Uncharacterized protein n=1 Tax=Angomonas deanei TaxID=59799 RepID=A0A7G2CE49_9TRYP|nr:hypothetical protein AGDE_07709 [Angomonas deanei]CAD2217665.1 hypothetical protein, conserved [Angomonas deanei]|eukprot:EPY34927.1 hypothetical protein AGDE_07709 [Angomonas deanei]